MSKRALVAVLVIAGLNACTPSTPRVAISAAEQRGRLEKNGLRFVIMPDQTTQLVEVDVRYEVGSREDPPGKAGLAHFVEHLMFQQKPDGPETRPMWFFLEQLSTFVNAYTNWDSTHYMVTSRKEHLDALLKIEAMRIHFGCQTISEEEFLRERDVVRNEIRQRTGTAEGQVPQLVMSAIYPKGHAYERMIGGDDEQLSSITMNDVCDFMKKYYVPERATLIVAGGIEIDETVAMIKKWFGNLEKRAPGPRAKVEPVVVSRAQKEIELDIERPQVVVAWALPDANTPEGENAQFGIWNAFFRTASKAYEYEFATAVQPIILGGQEAPVFAILIELKGMDKVDDALDFVWKGARSAHRGVDDASWAQLEEAKNRRKAEFITSIEPLVARTNIIGDRVQFAKDFDFDSSQLYLFHELDKIGKYDGAAIARATKKALDTDRARIVVFKPSEKGIKGDKRSKVKFETKSHDRRETPEVDPREAKKPMKVAGQLKALDKTHRFELGNGMKVMLLSVDSLPVVSAALMFDVGDGNAPGNPLLASSSARFLSLNADSISARDDVYYRTGINLGCDSTPDFTYCTTGGLNIYLDVMIKGLERLIKAGDYNQKGIENWQGIVKHQFTTKRAQQDLEYQRQVFTALYGPEHPYTRTGVITPDAIGRISRDDLSGFRNKHYTAGNATLVIAGKFDVKQAESLIRDAFGGWDRGHVDKPIGPEQFKRTGPVFVGVVGKEEPQMTVTIGYPAPAGIDGQEGARMVLTEMLNLRMGEIRHKLGATYGTYAIRDRRVGPSRYMMGGTVDAARAGEALKAMRDGIDSLRRGENFDEDFVRARRKLVGDMLGESTVSSQLVSQLARIAAFDLSADHYNKLLQLIAAASPAQIKRLLASELDPSNEAVVTMADRNTLTKAFADAGIKDVKLVEPEYK